MNTGLTALPWRLLAAVLAAALALACANGARGARIADVSNTPHNLSAAGTGTVRASSETQVCVFCHTPHSATPGAVPLWNRKLSSQTYTTYTSNSLDAAQIQGVLDQPGGSSKLCLSCHDGTLAIGNVNVLNGQGSPANPGGVSIAMGGTGPGGTMPPGAGTDTGFTRNLGFDLTNDHPISVTYSNALAQRDGELRQVDASQRWPAGSGSLIGLRSPGVKPRLPLEATGGSPATPGQMQCATCHDPHLRETDSALGKQKFLRLNRFQESTPSDAHNESGDIICLACHDKNQGAGTWAVSAHANPLVASQTYTAAAATQREFPAALPVWKAACLNCHDTHTVAGSRRLLREGTDSTASPKAGGNSAIEEVCYQCHSSTPVVVNAGNRIPDIRSEFSRAIRMPITATEQGVTQEAHDIGGNFADTGFIDCSGATNRCGKDFVESRNHLGATQLANRHAECTDCHNPHRVVKFRAFNGVGGAIAGAPEAAGTHAHTDDAVTRHSNIASGVLRGTWGVQPQYGSAAFDALPTGYAVKRGDPGISADTSVSAAFVTREYQICLKCHSDYGYTDNNVYPSGSRPALGRIGGTVSGTNGLTRYTNQAKEFQAPAGHKGETSTADSGAFAGTPPGQGYSVNFRTNNHRGWHPVMDATGRTPAVRGGLSANNWNFPWRNDVGAQTMYCSDCHGAAVTSATSVIPDGGENGTPWGPHGSSKPFLLKGDWDASTGSGQQANGLCFKCHNYTVYATRGETRTGFWLGEIGKDGHSHHADKIGRMRCTWCHAAVPHGWKNKALLVNLNDVGPEAGLAPGTQVRNGPNKENIGYSQEPYYLNAMLKVRNFRASGQWTQADCGSAGSPGNGQNGRDWMRDSNENCKNPP